MCNSRRAWFRTEEEISSSFGSPSCPRAATVTVTETCIAVATHFRAGARQIPSPSHAFLSRVTLTTTYAGILLPPTVLPIKESRYFGRCVKLRDRSKVVVIQDRTCRYPSVAWGRNNNNFATSQYHFFFQSFTSRLLPLGESRYDMVFWPGSN